MTVGPASADVGQRRIRVPLDSRRAWALGIALVAGVTGVAWLWGFMVDDALISARVAHHLATGQGYRFNTTGPPVDAVTPVGWAHLLAPFAASGVWSTWQVARWIGVASWLAAALLTADAVWRATRSRRALAPLLLLAAAPPAAWAVSGMETGLVTLLGALALQGGRRGACAAGVAAGARPELLPWALVWGGLHAVGDSARARPRARLVAVALALAAAALPALLVALLRQLAFGEPAPLSVWAKPSDLGHGLRYLALALLGMGIPWLLVNPAAWRRSGFGVRVAAAALFSHGLSVLAVGGDWMVLFRLMVPVWPMMLLCTCQLADVSSARWVVAGGMLALATTLWVHATTGRLARRVSAARADLVGFFEPPLRDRRAVAALDVGWVGAATSADLLDLAGVTDPVVAKLPGGHTSKRVSRGLLEGRDVDAALLLLAPGAELENPWWHSAFDRVVETRVALALGRDGFVAWGTRQLQHTEQRYLLVTAPRAAGRGEP